MPTPTIQRRWKSLPGEPAGDAGDPYTGYDRFGRTEAMRWIKPHVGDGGLDTLVNVQWGYSRASQKTWRKDLLAPASAQQDQHFAYDGLYQVTERTKGLLNVNTSAVGGIPAQAENFNYDETGNWVSYRQQNEGAPGIDETRASNRSNQMTQVDGSSAGVSYDRNGNMLTVPTGNGLTGPSRKLVWDAWNRLAKVSDADGGIIAEYQYDGLTRRTKVESGDITKHCYYNDQWRSVEERLDSATTPANQHVWHPTDRWELLFRDRSTENNGTLDERLYSLKDQLDPVAVCDASGSVVERFDYTAFGMPTFLDSTFVAQPSSSHDWSFLFHAEFADIETGWFNYGFRYYLPALGRWFTRDPLGEDGGLNLYQVIENSCANSIDLFGLAESQKKDCKWTYVISHSDYAIKKLGEWIKKMPKNGYPGSSCGNNKIGINACGGDYLNSLIPDQNRTSVGRDDYSRFDEDEAATYMTQLGEAGLKQPNYKDLKKFRDRIQNVAHDNKEIDKLFSDANHQCGEKNNCCKSIAIIIDCDPQFVKSYPGTTKASGFKNPCERSGAVACIK